MVIHLSRAEKEDKRPTVWLIRAGPWKEDRTCLCIHILYELDGVPILLPIEAAACARALLDMHVPAFRQGTTHFYLLFVFNHVSDLQALASRFFRYVY